MPEGYEEGMQYGMTARYPWYTEGVHSDPRFVWKLWDTFGIADSQMLGFWEPRPAVVASDDAVKVTAFKRMGRTLLSLGNYSDTVKTVTLKIDWHRLGLNAHKVHLVAPFVKNLQQAAEWSVDSTIMVQPRKGWLIYIE